MGRTLRKLRPDEYMELWARVVDFELHLGSIAQMRPATRTEDWLQATDLVLSIPAGEVALRVRDYSYLARFGPQWSIRAHCRGRKTEIHKIREGWARWYLFGYYDDQTETIGWWALIDLDAVRQSGILARYGNGEYVPNGDGTGACYISFSELASYGCIVESSEPIEHQLPLIGPGEAR